MVEYYSAEQYVHSGVLMHKMVYLVKLTKDGSTPPLSHHADGSKICDCFFSVLEIGCGYLP